MTSSTSDRPALPSITRRAALAGVATAAAAATAATSSAANAEPGPGVCILSPEAVEGPFYFDPALVRTDIAEERPGVPLELRLTLIEAAGCAPIPGARIDVWHCDAAGDYSGFDQTAKADAASGKRSTFMRGTQFADAAGAVAFRTVYPGWYPGRTPHIHLKAFLDGANVLTTQLYFPDALSEYIYANVKAYAHRDARDTINTTDGVLGHTENGRQTFVNLREETDRYVATLTIAVDRKARSETERRGPPPPGGAGDRPPPPGGPGGAEGFGPRPRPAGALVPGLKS